MFHIHYLMDQEVPAFGQTTKDDTVRSEFHSYMQLVKDL